VRTTVTLDDDVRDLLDRAMRERGLTFKEALNDAVRAGLMPADRAPAAYTTPVEMGHSRVDLTKALQLAGELEDQELLARAERGR
jgi:hypothetical protein